MKRPIVLQEANGAEHAFISRSRSILAGDVQAKGLASLLQQNTPFSEIE
jgi:hypothetical protein